MQNNLENIPKVDVIRYDGLPYLEFRKTLIPRYKKVWQDIGKAYFVILFFMLLSINLESILLRKFWILVPLFSLIVGFFLANLKLFIHEAAHENIHPDKKWNDRLANLFLCSWFGTSLQSYRLKDWQHHYMLGTVKDCESSYFNTLSLKQIFYYLSGAYFLENTVIKKINTLQNQNAKQTFMLLTAIGLNILILCVCIFSTHILTAVIWFLAIAVFLPFFSELRQILEHRDEWADPAKDFSKENHGKISRMFENSFLANTFGGAGFNRHMLHHWDPEISYTRFDELEDFLLHTPQCWVTICRSKTTYFDAFLSLVRF